MAAIDSKTVRENIRQFILDTFLFSDDTGAFSDADSFMQKGIIDSTGVLELTSFLEEKYEFQIKDEELVPTNLDSVDNLVAFICRKKS